MLSRSQYAGLVFLVSVFLLNCLLHRIRTIIICFKTSGHCEKYPGISGGSQIFSWMFIISCYYNIMIGSIIFSMLILGRPVTLHIIGDRNQLTQLQKHCENAYICYHDTVLICGKSVSEMRTFLDLCDLYEYSCEYSMVFRHVKEEEGICPNSREIG